MRTRRHGRRRRSRTARGALRAGVRRRARGCRSGAASTSTTNSSPPRRPIVSPSRSVAEQPGGDRLQQLVAGLVAERVVDLLEAVEVDEERGGLGAAAPGAGEHLLDAVEDQRAVGQPGQRIVQRLVADALEQPRVADRDRGLARDTAEASGELGVVDHALRSVDDIADHEADALVVDDDGDGRDRRRAELAHQHGEHVEVGRALAVPDGDRGVAGRGGGTGTSMRAEADVVVDRVAGRGDDAADGRARLEQRDRGTVAADDGRGAPARCSRPCRRWSRARRASSRGRAGRGRCGPGGGRRRGPRQSRARPRRGVRTPAARRAPAGRSTPSG